MPTMILADPSKDTEETGLGEMIYKGDVEKDIEDGRVPRSSEGNTHITEGIGYEMMVLGPEGKGWNGDQT